MRNNLRNKNVSVVFSVVWQGCTIFQRQTKPVTIIACAWQAYKIIAYCLKSYPIKYLLRIAADLASHTGAFRGARILSLPRKSPAWGGYRRSVTETVDRQDPPAFEPFFVYYSYVTIIMLEKHLKIPSPRSIWTLCVRLREISSYRKSTKRRKERKM